MSERETWQSFLNKWQLWWPEWGVAEAFIPEAQRETARGWLALRGEWADAAWAGQDPTPGAAKLAWWVEELQGWSQGAYRHPLGGLLQKYPVAWSTLGARLSALASSRTLQGDLASAVRGLDSIAQGLTEAAGVLFDGAQPAEPQDIALTLLAERALRMPPSGVQGEVNARGLLLQPRLSGATRQERIHAALLRGRLQRRLASKEGAAPRWRALWVSWQAARG